jgi:hypothetical protein
MIGPMTVDQLLDHLRQLSDRGLGADKVGVSVITLRDRVAGSSEHRITGVKVAPGPDMDWDFPVLLVAK